MTRKRIQIDWAKVAEAVKRCKLGCAQPGDQTLVATAFRADPVKYKTVSTEARETAVQEFTALWKG